LASIVTINVTIEANFGWGASEIVGGRHGWSRVSAMSAGTGTSTLAA